MSQNDLDMDLDSFEEEAKMEALKKKKAKKAEAKEELVEDKPSETKEPEQPQKPEQLAPGHHRGIGFVNKHGVLFPVGMKFEDGSFVSSRGNVVLNVCPKCGHQNEVTQAVKGKCEIDKCGYDALAKLQEITAEDFAASKIILK